eukprot:7289137-Alexandrium_andersonii.AAC.1
MSGNTSGARPCAAWYGVLPLTLMSALPANTRSARTCEKGISNPSRWCCSTTLWITSLRRAVLLSM